MRPRAGFLLWTAGLHTNMVVCALWWCFGASGPPFPPGLHQEPPPPSPLDSSSGPDVLRNPSSRILVQPGIIVYTWLDQKYSKRSRRQPAAARTRTSVWTLWSQAYNLTWVFLAASDTSRDPFAYNESDFCWSSAYYSKIFYSKTEPRPRCCHGPSRTAKCQKKHIFHGFVTL